MKRNKFNLSSTHLLSCDMGELVPIGLMEVLPGDSFRHQTRALVRCAPMLAPPMHPVRVRIHHWFVPLRLIWDDFEKFITGGPDGNDASVYPTMASVAVAAGGLMNYLGLPVTTVPAYSALPARAYGLIWNEFYRDQDLQTELVISRASGLDVTTPRTNVQNCCWEKDYFTSARPWEQKGPAVSIPLVGNAPIRGIAGANTNTYTTNAPSLGYRDTQGALPAGTNWSGDVADAAGTEFRIQGDNTSKNLQVYADLAAVTGVTVNNLRNALAIQRFEEARAMFGSRYAEYLRALGVRSSDARLQRPEYLGGGVQTIQFSEVIQSAADGANPVSTLRGHGISALRSNRYIRFFEEHGYVITLLSVLPKTIYSNALPRTFNRRTKFDYFQKELQNLGQQAVLNKEVRANHATPDGIFGYQDRYDEYRRSESRVSGEFSQSTLNFWHFARDFAADPALNATFVSAVPPERPFAAPSADVLYIHAQHSVQARRLLDSKANPRTF